MKTERSRGRALGTLLRAAALLSVVAAACSRGPATRAPVRSARMGDAGPAFESPARWLAFPQTVGAAMAAMTLADGRCLVAVDDGQRWIVTPTDKAHPCVGAGVASGSPTLEPLVGIERTESEFRFIAQGGGVYTSKEPNGPFTRFVRSPTYLRRVAARGEAIVGLDDVGATYFFDGTAWKQAAVPKGARGIDLVADEKGRVLWLGAPESLLVSTDAGRTFAPAPGASPPHVGAYGAGVTKSGKLAAQGAIGALVWDGDGISRTSEPLAEGRVPDVKIEPTEGPRASAIAEGRAVLDGVRYYELLEAFEGSHFGLSRSGLGGGFERIALEELDACENVRITAQSGVLAFACLRPNAERGNLDAELFVSRDGGVTLERAAALVALTYSDVSIAVAKDGSILATGVCKQPAEAAPAATAKDASDAEEQARCNPIAPVLVRGGAITAGAAQLLQESSASSPLLSEDGRTAYFFGRSRRDSQPAIFVSKDGGHVYQMRTIEAPQTYAWDVDGAGAPDDGSSASYVRPLYVQDGARLTLDESGTLGLIAERDVGSAWVTLDADGRIANIGEPPEPSFMMGGTGNRVLALGYGQTDGALRGWESTDGGVTWAEIVTTPAVQRYGERGGTFTCSRGGCVLGDELVRIGWEGQSEAPLSVVEESPITDAPEIDLSTPISCALVPKSEWTMVTGRPEERPTVAGTFVPATKLPALPRLRDIGRGKVLFGIAATSPEDGSVEITSGAFTDEKGAVAGAVSKKALMGPAKSKSGIVASTMRVQPEGFIAGRIVVPRSKGGGPDATKKIPDIEIAWQNQITGSSGKKVVPYDAPWSSSLSVGPDFRPSHLELAGPGFLIQPLSADKATYADASSVTSFPYPALLGSVLDSRAFVPLDPAFAGGKLFGIGTLDRTPQGYVAISIAASSAGKKGAKPEAASAPDPHALTLGAHDAMTEWIFSPDRVGIAALDTAGNETTPPASFGAWLEADGSFGPPFELPTLGDLAARPQPCSLEDRRTTPRVLSAHFPRPGVMLFERSRHPVLINDANAPAGGAPASLTAIPADPQWLFTSGAILHGTKKAPCVAAWHAAGLKPGLVAVMSSSLDQAFLIRVTTVRVPGRTPTSIPTASTHVEVRPMVCRYQPDLSVPYEVAARASVRMTDDTN